MTDETEQTKITISVLLWKVLEMYYKARGSFHVWSDGPSQQFKNRFMITFFEVAREHFDQSYAMWSFFATSHGKGAIDGMGGSIKRAVANRIKTRKALVKSASDFPRAVDETDTKVNCVHVPKDEIHLT
ncbi:MAG: hypothetical protein AAGK05_11730 [Pseudomonadota bacterium]